MDRKKKPKSPFSWPFSSRRQLWIADADRMISDAADLIDDPAVPPYLPNQSARYRRAARLYEKSAVFYSRAGLGVMAQGSWQDAAETYAILADEHNTRRCEGMADSIETYWEDEE